LFTNGKDFNTFCKDFLREEKVHLSGLYHLKIYQKKDLKKVYLKANITVFIKPAYSLPRPGRKTPSQIQG